MSALGFSIVASVVLTVALNVVLWLVPGAGRRLHESLTRLAERSAPPDGTEPGRSNVRFVFPWKAMLIGSLVLTIAINLVLVVLH
jgi:hypothetical protein